MAALAAAIHAGRRFRAARHGSAWMRGAEWDITAVCPKNEKGPVA